MKFLFKWAPRLILCVIILFLAMGVANWFLNKPAEAPGLEKAPWGIQTYSNDQARIPSRIYYAKEVKILDDGTPVIIGYWSYDGKNFKYNKGEKAFPIDRFGTIGITRRM